MVTNTATVEHDACSLLQTQHKCK